MATPMKDTLLISLGGQVKALERRAKEIRDLIDGDERERLAHDIHKSSLDMLSGLVELIKGVLLHQENNKRLADLEADNISLKALVALLEDSNKKSKKEMGEFKKLPRPLVFFIDYFKPIALAATTLVSGVVGFVGFFEWDNIIKIIEILSG